MSLGSKYVEGEDFEHRRRCRLSLLLGMAWCAVRVRDVNLMCG
jgi:hypothetical protein